MIVLGVDIFSGRPNPRWVIDGREAKSILKMMASKRDIVSRIDREYKGYEDLGYRGIYVGLLSDDLALEYDLPHHFMILNGAASQGSKDLEIGTRLVRSMIKYPLHGEEKTRKPSRAQLSKLIEKEMVKKVKQKAAKISHQPTIEDREDLKPVRRKTRSMKKMAKACCYIELCSFNPSFWNNCKTIKQNNNCYNYGTNRRTDTFAQPGRASGYYPYSMSCNPVKNAALSDGAHVRYDCFPGSEAPRYLMAMVVWPGTDYHWYRKHCEGFWGHKPGSTNAKNTDNNGNVIYDPSTCARGGYTDFCGYFYSCKSMVVS
jgi:hypothetical protein